MENIDFEEIVKLKGHADKYIPPRFAFRVWGIGENLFWPNLDDAVFFFC